jgi:cellulose synthase/poly-beta-1,6-N-acetylglucosamine synthase-like glycosyltransferase/spore germination protein YaaH/peptidoglycan/xylan/chitin deacetylase (PgdA/CDA1 family)
MDEFVFHDPTGRRAKRANLGLGLLLAAAALMVAAFFATLAFAPLLPDLTLKDPQVRQALHAETAHRLKRNFEWRRVPRPGKLAAGGRAQPLSVGFYVTWDEDSRTSLLRHVNQLDVVSPQWVLLDGSLGRVAVTSDPQAEAIIAGAKPAPSVLPMVHNVINGVSVGSLADNLLLNPAAEKALISNLVVLAQQRGYAGYVFDLENLSPAALARYPALVAEARAALKPIGREVWVATPFGDSDWPLAKLTAAADTVVLMAYDQHWATGEPGPVTGQEWFEKTLAEDLKLLDPQRTVVALGAYGYDWTLKDKTGPESADTVEFYDATQLAHDADAPITFDDNALNPTFAYEDDNHRKHVVWFLDAATFHNQVKVADDYRPEGYAIWRMGAEDPAIWNYLRQPYGSAKTTGLERIAPSTGVDFDGTGEVLHVAASPTPGQRTIEIDPDTGLISDEAYKVMPTSYVIDRYGAHPGWVALTFDDGPDSRWTPKILDILEQKHVPATFFVIGENMQTWPGLVKREVNDGMIVGNHTWTHPNIAATPLAQTDLEINTTQRLFAVLTGRSMRFFRPPYFGDAEPSTPQEVEPLLVAQRLGYLIAGLRIDTEDWQKPTPEQIVNNAMTRLADTNPLTGGQVVLMHDSGGDRSRTVEALPALIDAIRARGLKLVTLDQLAGMSRADAMPPTSRSAWELFLDRIGFGFFRYLNVGMQGLFVIAIVLGVARLAFLAVLSLWHRFREPGREPPMLDKADGPMISVLIPCYNEEKVIVSSVERILQSDWTHLEILVVDDGSKDRTSAVVREAYANEPRVTLLTFENGGKARALNRGLGYCKGEIVVALDADTLFPPETLPRLARWFADPRVGAVAGNAIVGNRLNLVTRWQGLEYVTAQNLERRALAALGAVTVVPGAVGAWRKALLLALGGYPADTLAEDQDLTLACQSAGWRVEFDSSARAYTEAPDTVKGLLNQRFRWSFGTLQCIWKHRRDLFSTRRPVLGFVALPQIWLFQIFLTVASPLVDLAIVSSLAWAFYGHYFHPVEWSPDDTLRSLFYWAAFIFLDLSAGALGMALERRAPWGDLVWLPVQRFGYRQLMYWVVVRSVVTAIRGYRVGWGKLERRATAVVGKAG